MPDRKPVVLVTRRLPDVVEDRVRRDYDARLNPEDELIATAAEAGAMLTDAST